MNSNEDKPVRIAVLDMNNGHPNQGMRCIRQIITEWTSRQDREVSVTEFEVRQKLEIPDNNFDMYISSGGPGDPLSSRFDDWDIAWCKWVDEMLRWNGNPGNKQKKFVFFICHSFQLASRYLNAGRVYKRKSTSFGVFPIYMLEDAGNEPVFAGLNDPFYAVDSRDYQVIQPNHSIINQMGGAILCIEKHRPHVPYERAVMGIRFNNYMIGTQFHPEADARGMYMYLQQEEKRETVIKNHGEEKLNSMLEQLNDPEKISWTYSHILPNFLDQFVETGYQPG